MSSFTFLLGSSIDYSGPYTTRGSPFLWILQPPCFGPWAMLAEPGWTAHRGEARRAGSTPSPEVVPGQRGTSKTGPRIHRLCPHGPCGPWGMVDQTSHLLCCYAALRIYNPPCLLRYAAAMLSASPFDLVTVVIRSSWTVVCGSVFCTTLFGWLT